MITTCLGVGVLASSATAFDLTKTSRLSFEGHPKRYENISFNRTKISSLSSAGHPGRHEKVALQKPEALP